VYVHVNWQHTVEELRTLYQQERDGKRRQRLHALWLIRQRQHTVAQVAALVGATEVTLHRWLNWYRAGGLATLDAHRVGQAGGVVARLSLEDQAVLAAYAGDGAFRTIDEVRQWVATTCGVTYSYWGMRSLLDRLHLHAKVPRPVNPKADPAAQAAWKKGA
jgi:transposase